MEIPTLDDLEARGRRLGVRVDVNSPLSGAGLADDARLHAHLGTLSELIDAGGRVAILAHQGRPGRDDFGDLSPHAARFDELLDASVDYVDCIFSSAARSRIDQLDDGEVVVLENTRFFSEELCEFPPERAAESFLVDKLASVLDVYVNDAFAAAHRSQPSLVGFPVVLPSFAGRVMEQELAVLGNIDETDRPRVYALGGAKVKDSIHVAERVLERDLADEVLTMGVVGNLFLSAGGTYLGEGSARVFDEFGVTEYTDRATSLLETYPNRIRVPIDVAIDRKGERSVVTADALPVDEPALDIGPETIDRYVDRLETAGTAILNGPAGVAERPAFAAGTRAVYEAATRAGMSIIGGGDTAAALRGLKISGFTHWSTGGGASMRMLAGDPLPAVEALQDAG